MIQLWHLWLAVIILSAALPCWGEAPPSPEARRNAYLERLAQRDGGLRGQMARLALGKDVESERLYSGLGAMDERHDCADFTALEYLRLLYQFGHGGRLPEAARARIRESLLNFKYWPDEPGIDSMCSWSENHYMAFAAAGYLAGQLYPHDTFGNANHSGIEKMERHRPRVWKWLELRYKTGFSEWLSNEYYAVNYASLTMLSDYCSDTELAERARMVLDVMTLDMALNQFQGSLCSTRGRSYESDKKYLVKENTAPCLWLLFGQGTPEGSALGALHIALSESWRMPPALGPAAQDTAPMVNRQRMGIRIRDAHRWGLGFGDVESGMHFLTLESYFHPRVIPLYIHMLDEFSWWRNDFFGAVASEKKMLRTLQRYRLTPLLAWMLGPDINRNLREEVNIYTYRTPHYLLGTAQDYQKGNGGDQHQIWQANLGGDATCFTTHPVGDGEGRRGGTPDYWAGSASLPRAAQHENVCVVIYQAHGKPGLYVKDPLPFTHAWLPAARFDEVHEEGQWVFARKNGGYLGLWSRVPWRWSEAREDGERCEIIADGLENVWICEMGSADSHGGFEEFRRALASAPIHCEGQNVHFASPSAGAVRFGWKGPLTVGGEPQPLRGYPRYQNRLVNAAFPLERVGLANEAGRWRTDWEAGTRQVDSS